MASMINYWDNFGLLIISNLFNILRTLTTQTKLKATILGSGTSVGVPVIGCDCETCRSSDPRDNRTRSSLFLQAAGQDIIIDTGPDFRQQCLRENIRNVDAVLYTHAHIDHVTGFDDLRRFSAGPDEVIQIYGTPETLADLQRMFAYAFNGENRYPGYVKPVIHLIDGPFQIGALRISPVDVQHGKVRTIGFVLALADHEDHPFLAYFPDCKKIPDDSLAVFQNVDTLVIDALRHSEHFTHMNFTEALEFSAKIKPRRTIFTHIADEVLHARDESSLPENVRIAYDGLQLTW